MAGRRPPEQHPPPVQWLRVRYAKRGRARFTSHRDFGRAFERALRRARVPMAYSSGFSPHPRISYANASPTGAASEAEYLDIGLAEPRDPEWLGAALDAALPEGLTVVKVAVAAPGSLADQLTASWWQVTFSGVPEAGLRRVVAAFLVQSEITVERLTKHGIRSFDVRGSVLDLRVEEDRLDILIEHRTPLVRPDDVLSALPRLDPGWAPDRPPLMTRASQGTVQPGTDRLLEPL